MNQSAMHQSTKPIGIAIGSAGTALLSNFAAKFVAAVVGERLCGSAVR